MGTTHFQLPAGLTPESLRDLERACLTGGQDNLPWPTTVQLEGERLSLTRINLDESGCVVAPWSIAGAGRFMGLSATLMERAQPYDLQIELARGKVNQLRNQAWDWQAIGLHLQAPLLQQIRDAGFAFGRAVTQPATEEGERQTQAALMLAYLAAEQLVQRYIEQLFHVRHQRLAHFETALSCVIGPSIPEGKVAKALLDACNHVSVPFSWHAVEAEENDYAWENSDALLDWAKKNDRPVIGGPLIDFAAARLPAWLWLWEQDVKNIAQFMCTYVTAVISRYHDRIRTWNLTAASNNAALLQLREEDFLYLTVKIVEAARRIDPKLDLIVGISQPWGEYLAQKEHSRSPFIFADELIRSGVQVSGLNLELVMGVTPRGNYSRDLLDTSRILDTYALLGVPLHVTLGYPSSTGSDLKGDPELRVAGGHWHEGFSPTTQADWFTAFASLTLSKPYITSVTWPHLSDVEPHQFPHSGLIDAAGDIKPIVPRFKALREKHLN